METLASKQNDILINILRLVLTIIAKSETFAVQIAEYNDSEMVSILLTILTGPKIPLVQFNTKVKHYVLLVLRQLIKFNLQVKQIVMDEKHLESLQAVRDMISLK